MPTLAGAAGIISDDFYEGSGAKSPDPGWTFDDTDTNDCTQTWETPGTADSLLVITVGPDNNHYADVGTWDAPTLLQTATTGDFRIETKIQSLPFAANYDEGGIVVQYSGGYLICGTWRNGANQMVYGWNTGEATQETSLGAYGSLIPIWLSITKSGSSYTCAYDMDGAGSFTTVATFTEANAVSNVGCYAGNDSVATANTVVKFDYFIETTAGDIRATEDSQAATARRVFVIT
jgi:hypothetical protein